MRKSCKKPPDRTKSVKGGQHEIIRNRLKKSETELFVLFPVPFSVSFVLMIYFCFTSFSMNQIIMEKISSDGRVETMCRTVAVFIMAFVIFYMFYSNSFFMRRRMRELGIYSLLGYRKSTILKLLIFENVMICFGGMILGILTGSILHKIVIAGIVTLLGISVDQSAIPLIYPAAVKAILSFVIVVLITLTLSNASLLRKSTLLDLVRLEKKTEKPIHPQRYWVSDFSAQGTALHWTLCGESSHCGIPLDFLLLPC